MLDIDKIQQLVDMMITNDLEEISLRDGDVEVSLRRSTCAANNGSEVLVHTASSNSLPGPAPVESPPVEQQDEETELVEIKSPMVGTFYLSPDPESPPYVQSGSQIQPQSVVCIVEAMKVFNEIKAEVSGTIERILLKNEQSVEFGQPMFLVRPQ